MPAEQSLDRFQVVVKQMLVIDLVEGQIFDDSLHVQELHDKDAIVGQAMTDAIRDAVQFFQMKENAGGVDHIELATQ